MNAGHIQNAFHWHVFRFELDNNNNMCTYSFVGAHIIACVWLSCAAWCVRVRAIHLSWRESVGVGARQTKNHFTGVLLISLADCMRYSVLCVLRAACSRMVAVGTVISLFCAIIIIICDIVFFFFVALPPLHRSALLSHELPLVWCRNATRISIGHSRCLSLAPTKRTQSPSGVVCVFFFLAAYMRPRRGWSSSF